VNIRVSDEVYSELVRRYGVRGLSRAVEELLREALFGEAAKTPSVLDAKPLKRQAF
jgi:Arc/MetJ family transcription regulator